MTSCAWYWLASAALGALGGGVAVANFNVESSPWRLLGMTMIVLAATCANTGYMALRSRTLDEEFDAGYRVGYRAGRRVPALSAVTPMRKASDAQSDRGVTSGRVPKAPVRPVAGHRANSGWAQAHPH